MGVYHGGRGWEWTDFLHLKQSKQMGDSAVSVHSTSWAIYGGISHFAITKGGRWERANYVAGPASVVLKRCSSGSVIAPGNPLRKSSRGSSRAASMSITISKGGRMAEGEKVGQCPLRLLAGALRKGDGVSKRLIPICVEGRCSWWLEMGGCAVPAVGEGVLAIANILGTRSWWQKEAG